MRALVIFLLFMLTLIIKQDKLIFMQFKKIENSQLNVSTICLGTMTMGSQNKELIYKLKIIKKIK